MLNCGCQKPVWKSGGQQIGCANLWLSAAWKMLYFSGKGGGQQIDCAKMWLSREIRAPAMHSKLFLEKYLPAKIFVEKNSLSGSGTRISREIDWGAWLGRVFLEKKARLESWGAYFSGKKAGLESWGAYFSKKRLDWKAGARISRGRG